MSKTVYRAVADYLVVIITAITLALNYEILIFSNSFAPAGINGIATIIQHLFNFQFGYFSLIINVPLIVLAFIFVGKDFSIKTLVFVLIYSLLTSVVFKNGNGDTEGLIDLSRFVYSSDLSKLLAPVASGAISGVIYGFVIKANGCTGGTDIVARLVRVRHPELNIMWVMFGLNSVVAVLSFFAYAENGKYNLEPVILCLVYCLLSSSVGDIILKGTKNALKFEVVTSHPEEISKEIIERLKHTATVVQARGMFSHSDKSLLICVVNKNQIVDFEQIVKKYPETFAYLSSVNEIVGNFVHTKKTL